VVKALLSIVLMASLASAQDSPKCVGCGKETYGTTVQWMGTPSDAATKAKAEEKLVFVLHVSGHFEDPNFT
jgi:hypothetical protein